MEGLGTCATLNFGGVLHHSIVNLTPKTPIGATRLDAFRKEDRISEGADRSGRRAFETRPLVKCETEAQLSAKALKQLVDPSVLHGAFRASLAFDGSTCSQNRHSLTG